MPPVSPSNLGERLLDADGEATRPPNIVSEVSKDMKEGVSKLPDLTKQLQEEGLYDKFLAHREGNRRWRTGKEKGAKGEPTVSAITSSAAKDFVKLNPSVPSFTFRRTLSFWMSALYIIGCWLFLWTPLFGRYTSDRPRLQYSLTKGPTLAGGMFFCTGIYASYVEIINLDIDVATTTVRWIFFPSSLLQSEQLSIWSLISALLYLFGAGWYTCAQLCDFYSWSTKDHEMLIEWPLIVGGFCFFLGGAAELIINRIWEFRCDELVFWVTICDFIGGICFWTSACPSFFKTDMGPFLVGEVGVVFYVTAAICSLFMWQGEQFGGAVIPALNRALREGGHLEVVKDPKSGVARIITPMVEASTSTIDLNGGEKKKLSDVVNPRLSWRAIVFLNVFLVMGAVQVLSCCIALFELHEELKLGGGASLESLNDFITSFGHFMIVAMFLVLSSACVMMPQEEPYHTLVWMLRLMGVLLLMNSVLALFVQSELTPLIGLGQSLSTTSIPSNDL